MKNIYLILLLLTFVLQLSAQGTLKINSGANIKTKNNAFIVLNNMNVVNNGTYVQAVGDGTTILTGNTNTNTSGAGTTTLDQLLVAINNANSNTLSSLVSIKNVVTLSTGQLISNGFLTLKSDANNTASVALVTSPIIPAISGDAIIERYNSARKGWRFLSIPTNTTQTINQAWQEGCGSNLNCVSGFGTQITGSGGTAAGFDVYTSTPSMKSYNSSSNTWVGIPNTNSTNIKSTNGYMVFVRGDRSATAFNSTPTQTVLRTTGALYIGNLTSIAVSAGTFGSIGNPYASALDMRNITKTGLKDFFYVWDPQLAGSYGYGGYQTFSNSGGNYVIIPGGGSYGTIGSISNYIQSGQAFFVQGDVGGGSLTFKENAKASGSRLVTVAASAPQPQLLACLLGVNADNSTYMADGFLVNYGDSYCNCVDDMDALKLTNTSENLAIKRDNALLVVERRHTITGQDTIFINLTNVKVQNYQFKFTTDQLYQPGITGFLSDSYLNTTTPINIDGNTTVNFNIANIPGSYAANRFMIVFSQQPTGTLPVTFTSVKAYPLGSNINVEWKVDNENNIKQYIVEKSTNGNQFASIASLPATANNGGSASYAIADIQPVGGYNYYRIKSVDLNGATATTNIVKVLMGEIGQEITVYPNPVINGKINLVLNNQPAGKYGIRIYNKSGQVIKESQVQHAEGSSTETIKLDNYTPHGIYQLEVMLPGGTRTNIRFVN